MTSESPPVGGLAAAGHVPGTAAAEVGVPARHTHRDVSHVAPAAHLLALAEVADTPLDVGVHEKLVASRAAGAVVSFAGVVRDHDGGRVVRELEYVAHPSAGDILREIAAEFAAMDYVEAIAVSHRTGSLAIGDTALACAVSTAHRAQAFELCGRLVDEVKARLPIWKRQVFDDGTEEWVDCP